jgi:hypothetical protein
MAITLASITWTLPKTSNLFKLHGTYMELTCWVHADYIMEQDVIGHVIEVKVM